MSRRKMFKKILIWTASTALAVTLLPAALSIPTYAAHTHEFEAAYVINSDLLIDSVSFTCDCGEQIEGLGILDYDIDENYVEPTCTTDGQVDMVVYLWYTEEDFENEEDPAFTEELDDYVIPAYGHEWDEGFVEREATETEEGSILYTCEYCGETKSEVIPALGTSVKNPFEDVASTDYFYGPVLWAVENGITNGKTATTFTPYEECTRAQIVTFMWRAAGEPEPISEINPFTDVTEDNYYYKAVLWALEQGITNGKTETTFDPSGVCTRAQVMTMLWRAAGQPMPMLTECSFTDVTAGEYYYNAVLWAVENGITNGKSDTAFGTYDGCTRAQVVTFLYRIEVK